MKFSVLNKYLTPTIISCFLCLPIAQAAEMNLKDHVQHTASDGFDETGWWILGLGSAATVIAFSLDNQIHDQWKDHQQMSADISRFGDMWGTGIPETLIFAGQTYWDRENGIASFEGFLLGGVVTHSTKFLIGRERPDSHTRTAFPSGHTQAAFSLAASMNASYGWRVSLPFWFMGVFTGLTRLADNAHWLSDVVAGATVGTFFGRAGFMHHRNLQPIVLLEEGRPYGLAVKMDW